MSWWCAFLSVQWNERSLEIQGDNIKVYFCFSYQTVSDFEWFNLYIQATDKDPQKATSEITILSLSLKHSTQLSQGNQLAIIQVECGLKYLLDTHQSRFETIQSKLSEMILLCNEFILELQLQLKKRTPENFKCLQGMSKLCPGQVLFQMLFPTDQLPMQHLLNDSISNNIK